MGSPGGFGSHFYPLMSRWTHCHHLYSLKVSGLMQRHNTVHKIGLKVFHPILPVCYFQIVKLLLLLFDQVYEIRR